MRTILSATAALLVVLAASCKDGPTAPPPTQLPVPSLTGLSPDTARVGAANVRVRLLGSDFTGGSRIRWGDLEIRPTFLSSTELELVVEASLLKAAGTVSVAVQTSGTGGGTSNVLPFRIMSPVPVIHTLSSFGARAGGGGFTLSVYGEGFTEGSTVRVNGALRPTTFATHSTLNVAISAAELVSPGALAIEVVNPGPVERVSSSRTVTVRRTGTSTATVLRTSHYGQELAWSSHTQRLYMAPYEFDGPDRGRVIALNPHDAAVTDSLFVASLVTRLAASDDGRLLYVLADTQRVIRRVALETFTPGQEWRAPPGSFGWSDIAAVPGAPDRVAVSEAIPAPLGVEVAVKVFDDGGVRGVDTRLSTVATSLGAPGLPSRVFLYSWHDRFAAVATIGVTPSGTTLTRQTGSPFPRPLLSVTGGGGRLYAAGGTVIDGETHAALANLPVQAWGVAVDLQTGRAFYLEVGGIRVFDINDFAELGFIPTPTDEIVNPRPLVRWGTDGLAFLRSGGELVILRSPLAGD